MEAIPLLLIGAATDGPVETITPVESFDQAFRLFGGYQYESQTITSGATAVTLSGSPWAGQLSPLTLDADGALIPKRLFELSVSGNTCSFSALGPENSGTVIFRYIESPGAGSLIQGLLATRGVNRPVHLLRLGGTLATASSSGFSFLARHAGRRYNGTQVQVAAGIVTVVPAPGTGRQRVYTPTSDQTLLERMQTDYRRGFLPIRVEGHAALNRLSLETGTWTLTGGTDGAMSTAGFLQYVIDNELDGIDVICPLGLSTQAVSGAGILAVLAENDYPVLLVAQAPASGVALSGSPNTDRHLVAVAFQATYDRGTSRERVADAAPLAAALLAGPPFTGTLAALPENPPVPTYDAVGLHALASGGYLAAYHSISKGWALWHANTGDSDWPVSTYRAFQEIARVIYETLEPTLGMTVLDTVGLQALLAQGFGKVTGSQVVKWSLLSAGDTLYAEVQFTPHGEVRVVRGQIALGSPSAAQSL